MTLTASLGGRLDYHSLPSICNEMDQEESEPSVATEVTSLLPTSNVSQGQSQNDVSPVKRPQAGSSPHGYVPVELVCFLYFFNTVLAMPHTQFYVYFKISEQYGGVNRTDYISCEHDTSNTSVDDVEIKVQTEASTLTMYLTFAGTFSGVLPTLFFGSLTDRYGRKMACILAIAGTAVKQGLYIAVFISNANVNYLLIGSVVEGTCGYYGGMTASLFATVADITDQGKERAFRITSLEASLFLASAISQGVAGVWIEQTGFLIPLYSMIGISLLNMGVVVFLLPETRRRSLTPLSVTESFTTLKRSVLFYIRDTPDRRRWKLQVTVCAFFVTYATTIVFGSILILYLLKSPFCWSMIHITLYKAVRLLVDWGCILALTRCLGHVISDVNMAIIGSASAMLCLLMIGFADRDLIMYLAAAAGVFTESLTPMLRSTMSRLVSSDDQGALFSSISVVEMFSGAFLGLAATAVYTESVTFLPGLVFLCFSGLMACILVSLGFLSNAQKGQRKETAILFVK